MPNEEANNINDVAFMLVRHYYTGTACILSEQWYGDFRTEISCAELLETNLFK
ncbi:hypothetical protein D3C80_1075070 [compost metagenome]